jgi:hypothetical protein
MWYKSVNPLVEWRLNVPKITITRTSKVPNEDGCQTTQMVIKVDNLGNMTLKEYRDKLLKIYNGSDKDSEYK